IKTRPGRRPRLPARPGPKRLCRRSTMSTTSNSSIWKSAGSNSLAGSLHGSSPPWPRPLTSGSSAWRLPVTFSATPKLPPSRSSSKGLRRPRPMLWLTWSRSSLRSSAGPLNSRCKACARPWPRARRKNRRRKPGQPWPPPRSSESAKPTISAWSKGISSRSPVRRSGSSSNSPSPAVKDFLASRLKRIELVGKPAPPIQGTDLDGKVFNLAEEKGKVVLVVFWASWNLPSAAQISWFEQVRDAYHKRGLRVVGINLDAHEESGQKLETVLPNIRRFLLDYNITWPTLVNGSGDRDYA